MGGRSRKVRCCWFGGVGKTFLCLFVAARMLILQLPLPLPTTSLDVLPVLLCLRCAVGLRALGIWVGWLVLLGKLWLAEVGGRARLS